MKLTGFCRLWRRKGVHRALLVVFGLVVAFAVASGTERALRGSSEFMGFRRIVQVSLVENQDHYERIGHIRAYPPFFAVFWSPWGLLPVGVVPDMGHPLVNTSLSQQLQLGVSAALVLALMTAMTVWSARTVVSASLPEQERRPCLAALVWMLTGGLMLNSVLRCETDMFVVMLVAGGMHSLFVRRDECVGGFLLGVAAAFKLTPGLFGVYCLCRRKWRAAAGMIAAGIVCAGLMPSLVWGIDGNVQRHRSWVEKVIIPYGTAGPEEFISRVYRRANQSLKAAVVRYLTHYNAGEQRKPRYVNVADLSPQAAARIAMALKLAILAALMAAWIAAPAREEGDLGPVLFALVPLGMLLLSDVSVGGHLAILAVPAGVLAAYCFRHDDEPVARRLSWCVLGGVVLANLIAVKLLKELSFGTFGVLALLLVTLWLAVCLLREGRAARRAAEATAPPAEQ